MKDDKLYLDLYRVEHPQAEHLADELHRADMAEGKGWHWTIGLSSLEQLILTLSAMLLLTMLIFALYRAMLY
jgi:hypothetical protein